MVLVIIFVGTALINVLYRNIMVPATLNCEDDGARGLAKEYFEVYGARKDFERFLSFYAESMVLEDMVNGDRIIGKKNFATFFNWGNPNYKKLDSLASGMIIEELVIDKNRIVAKGHFAAFQWGNAQFESMQFCTWLFLNNDRKIIRQVDWINYPSTLVDYDNRKNSNEWIQ